MAKNTISLTLMVDKSSKRVVFAESNGHFVQVLLTFLTLPLASILRLASKPPFGSIRNLFHSVESLGSDCFCSEACRSMLLRPLNSAAELVKALPIDYDSQSHKFCYFICKNRSCLFERLAFYENALCPCKMLMNRRVQIVSDSVACDEEAHNFLLNSFKYLISDDLTICQSSTEVTIEMLSKLRVQQGSSLKSMQVDVTAEKIIELLEQLLVSDTPLTDIFLGSKNEDKKPKIFKPNPQENFSETVGLSASKRISVKLFLNKETNKVIYAEGDKEFADLFVSFLTYPMGSVVNKLSGNSGIRCFDNLHKSIEALKLTNCFKKDELIGKLQKPKLPLNFSLKDPLIKLNEQPVTERYYMCRTSGCESDKVSTIPNINCNRCQKPTNKRLTLTDPPNAGEYMMSSRYIVTDDLGVSQLSSVMLVADFMREFGEGVIAKNVEIGEHEALLLLHASISSKKVFTDAFLGSGEAKTA